MKSNATIFIEKFKVDIDEIGIEKATVKAFEIISDRIQTLENKK